MIPLTIDNVRALPDTNGIYKIYACNKDGKAISINRFCNIDTTGLLCIGRTAKQGGKTRLYQFYASSSQDYATHNHSAGLKYKVNEIIRERLGEHTLYFSFTSTDDPIQQEKLALQEYSKKFGEYPPLNK